MSIFARRRAAGKSMSAFLVDPDQPDYIGYDQVAAEHGEDVARALARHAYLAGLDGRPCWAADHLAELLLEVSR